MSELEIIYPACLQDKPIPERQWLVKEWIPVGSVTALYGDGGTGKSLLAMMLMTCCALHIDFMGLPTKWCRVFGVFCEDDADELHRRQAAILKYYNREFADLQDMEYTSRVGDNNILMNFKTNGAAENTSFFADIEKAAKNFGAELIIIDTAADTFGGNENVRPQVRQYIAACLTRLAKSINGTVVLCTHPSVTGIKSEDGSGGSTAWNNSVRSRLYLSRIKKDEKESDLSDNDINRLRILSKKKANYSTIGDEITLEYKDGVFAKRYDTPNAAVSSFAISYRNREIENAFLESMDNIYSQGRNISDSANASNYAPKYLRKDPKCKEFTFKELSDAMYRLFNDKKIKVEIYGKKSQPSKRIVKIT